MTHLILFSLRCLQTSFNPHTYLLLALLCIHTYIKVTEWQEPLLSLNDYLSGVLEILSVLEVSQVSQKFLHVLIDTFSYHVITVSERNPS